MKISTLLLPLLPSVALAAKKMDNSAAVVTDIGKVSTDLTTLNTTLNGFKPDAIFGLATALKIQQETTALQNQIQDAINDAKNSSAFSSDNSYTVAFATVGLIDPINSTLSNIVAHKPAFASAVLLVGDLSKTVEQSLIEQRNLTAQLGTVLGKKLASPYNSFAPQVTAQILSLFDAAIKKYKTCSGVLCLPPI